MSGRMSPTENNRNEISQREAKARRKFGFLLTLLIVGTVLSLFLASLFGRLDISVANVGKSILAGLGFNLDPDLDTTWVVVVFNIRLSRICLSMLVGMALAVAGTVEPETPVILRSPRNMVHESMPGVARVDLPSGASERTVAVGKIIEIKRNTVISLQILDMEPISSMVSSSIFSFNNVFAFRSWGLV